MRSLATLRRCFGLNLWLLLPICLLFLAGCGGNIFGWLGFNTGGGTISNFSNGVAITNYAPRAVSTAGGALITVTGRNFLKVGFNTSPETYGTVTSAALSQFDEPPVTAALAQSVTSTKAEVTVPALPAGNHTLTLVASDGNGHSQNIVVGVVAVSAPAVPVVKSISPKSGPTTGGTVVVIDGTGFTGAMEVYFGSTPGTGLNVKSDSALSIVSPPDTGTVQVRVKNAVGTSTIAAADAFTYLAAPVVTAISPTSGPPAGGTSVTISGSGFTSDAIVYFGPVDSAHEARNVVVVSSSEITATAPAGTGTINVLVKNAVGVSPTSSADQYTYATGPTITSVTPTSEGGGSPEPFVITGTGFTPSATVNFQNSSGNVVATSVTYLGPTQLRALPSAQLLGVYDIRVTTAQGTSPITAADRVSFF